MTVVTAVNTVSDGEKREALEAVLNSTTFSRSAQLKAFLRYVCEMDLGGRGHELTEYQIAVEVLGRRKDFDLADDSSVRNRAYELRQRLEKFYSAEQPRARLRIEIPRGGYIPTYIRVPELTPEGPPTLDVPAVVLAIPPTPTRRFRRLVGLVGLIIVLLGLAMAAGWMLSERLDHRRPDAVLAEAWGPLATAGDNMVICLATNLHMLVRPHIPAIARRYPAPPELAELYGTTRPAHPGEVLYMEPALLSIPLAELSATVTVANTRAAFGGSYQILPESESPTSALRGRNAVVFGTSVNSRGVSLLLRDLPLNIAFNAQDRFALVDQRKPEGQNEMFTAQPGSDPIAMMQYGLLTVLSSTESTGRATRIAVISGTGSAAVQAGAEFFSSPARMAEMKKRFSRGFPASYQVVLRCKTYGIRLMSYEYVTHAVVQE